MSYFVIKGIIPCRKRLFFRRLWFRLVRRKFPRVWLWRLWFLHFRFHPCYLLLWLWLPLLFSRLPFCGPFSSYFIFRPRPVSKLGLKLILWRLLPSFLDPETSAGLRKKKKIPKVTIMISFHRTTNYRSFYVFICPKLVVKTILGFLIILPKISNLGLQLPLRPFYQ